MLAPDLAERRQIHLARLCLHIEFAPSHTKPARVFHLFIRHGARVIQKADHQLISRELLYNKQQTFRLSQPLRQKRGQFLCDPHFQHVTLAEPPDQRPPLTLPLRHKARLIDIEARNALPADLALVHKKVHAIVGTGLVAALKPRIDAHKAFVTHAKGRRAQCGIVPPRPQHGLLHNGLFRNGPFPPAFAPRFFLPLLQRLCRAFVLGFNGFAQGPVMPDKRLHARNAGKGRFVKLQRGHLLLAVQLRQ